MECTDDEGRVLMGSCGYVCLCVEVGSVLTLFRDVRCVEGGGGSLWWCVDRCERVATIIRYVCKYLESAIQGGEYKPEGDEKKVCCWMCNAMVAS